MKSKTLIAAAALAAVSMAAQAQAPQYSITELGISAASTGGSSLSSWGGAISSNGNYVVGRSLWQSGSTIYSPDFTWTAGTGMTDWTMPTGRFGSNSVNTIAVNNNGVVVASLGTNAGNASLAPFVWNGSTATALALPSGQVSGKVADINDSNKAVGSVGSGSSGTALIWDASNPSAAPTSITATASIASITIGSSTYTNVTAKLTNPTQINNAGYVVGTGFLTSGNTSNSVALAYDGTNVSFIDLSGLGAMTASTQIYGLSENGWVVGTYSNMAFRWKADVGAQVIAAPTGVTGSVVPYAINSNGEVVGKTGSGTSSSLFYFDGSTSYSMNSLIAGNAGGWTASNTNATAYGIADNGSIVMTGFSASVSGGARALLLTPVPEPTTWALMLAGMVGVGTIVRRRTAQA